MPFSIMLRNFVQTISWFFGASLAPQQLHRLVGALAAWSLLRLLAVGVENFAMGLLQLRLLYLSGYCLAYQLWAKCGALILSAVALVISSTAWGFQLEHEYNWRGRSPYGAPVYVHQQAGYERTLVPLVGEQKRDFRGLSLHSAVGVEHMRFLQTGLFYSNVSAKDRSNKGNSWQGHEMGAEVKVVLFSPVVNVALLGGAFLAKKEYRVGLESGQLQGSGGRGGLEFSYFVSSKVSLVFSGVQHTETLSPNSSQSLSKSVKTQSSRLGAGLSIWL